MKDTLQSVSTSLGLLLLRAGVGLSMLLGHGWSKLQNFSSLSGSFPDPIGLGSTLGLILAIGAEVGCAILIVLGLLTRIAALPLAFTMLVAGLIVHAQDPWQKKELAFVYLAAFLALALTGPGIFSLDRWLWGRKKAAASSKE
jgi:putative oxidoreductase